MHQPILMHAARLSGISQRQVARLPRPIERGGLARRALEATYGATWKLAATTRRDDPLAIARAAAAG